MSGSRYGTARASPTRCRANAAWARTAPIPCPPSGLPSSWIKPATFLSRSSSLTRTIARLTAIQRRIALIDREEPFDALRRVAGRLLLRHDVPVLRVRQLLGQ